ncbi:hypothetical protein IMCC20628_00751 [Hoeflea sp. IMCC20628]|uniref:hypothetical protein n=1 Tax=Hoeflea sp. IMCC20628 TaxID=1620421 RepID=UPI00063A9D4A|nr:hypothetical protein [Hoeflea sp. IMCC20628]AKH99472.1 hypothetical protein IMCC20628_00751 [Hoeflea sp. IMCC20628]
MTQKFKTTFVAMITATSIIASVAGATAGNIAPASSKETVYSGCKVAPCPKNPLEKTLDKTTRSVVTDVADKDATFRWPWQKKEKAVSVERLKCC